MPTTTECTQELPLNHPEPLVRSVMPELDTIRGLAILGVLFLHGFEWQYGGLHFGPWAREFMMLTQPGWLGVNLFFVLSGFLITGILIDSKRTQHYYRRFYTRRALRILPAYYLLLAVLLISRSSSPAFVGLSFIYLANMTDLFGVASGYGVLWSLAVEEHFYLLWPAIVKNLTPKRLALVSLGIVVVTPLLRASGFILGYGGLDWYTWFVADGLALGSLLAIALRTSISRTHVKLFCSILLGTALLALVFGRSFGITTRQRLLGASLQYSIINLFFAGMLLLFLLIGTSSHQRFVNRPLLRFFGYISYGLYLNHILFFHIYDAAARRFFPNLIPAHDRFDLVVLKFVIAGGTAVGAAYISRRYFEERFLRLKDNLGVRRSAPGSDRGFIPKEALPTVS